MKEIIINENDVLYKSISDVLEEARKKVVQSINTTMVFTYFEVGKIIVEHEQEGDPKAKYNEKVLDNLSTKLTKEFGKGFIKRNLELMRQFYIVYGKANTLYSQSIEFKLSWSHYVRLMRMDDNQRKFYEIEAIENNWSVRELERQFNTALFERLALSKDKDEVKKLNTKGQIITKPADAIKEPYVLEFLGLEEQDKYSESDLESKLINKMEDFLLELGKGFAFVARQKRISFDGKHFFMDLVFYNYILKSFVIIDLKIGELTHQDLGQLQMYVNYYDREIKSNEDNKTIGIILCADKSNKVVEFTLPEENKQIFASKYQLYLPSKSELKVQLEKILEED